MKRIKALLLVLSIIMLISGCNKPQTPPVQETPGIENSQNSEDPTEQKIVKSSEIDDDVLKWHTVSSFEDDVDGDGEKETVALLTSAEQNKKGDFFWNDGQNWALSVTDGADYYLLYKEYVSAGYPYFEVSEYYEQDGHRTQIDLVVSSGARLMLKGYSYSKDKEGYIETVIYDTNLVTEGGVNKKYSSFPAYSK